LPNLHTIGISTMTRGISLKLIVPSSVANSLLSRNVSTMQNTPGIHPLSITGEESRQTITVIKMKCFTMNHHFHPI